MSSTATFAYPGGILQGPALPLQIEQTYETPAGFRDFPFIYVYDGSGLVNGVNAYSQRVRIDGTADFILRAIFGFRYVLAVATGKFPFKNYWGSYCSSAPMIMNAVAAGVISPIITSGAMPLLETVVPTHSLRNPDTWQVLPEKRYPYDSQISFDLINPFLTSGSDGSV